MSLSTSDRWQKRHTELGFWLGVPFWNNRYVTEAAKAVLKFGFEQISLHKIYATHLFENPASEKVMIKNGMIKEGELVDHIRKFGRYLSLVQYRITKEEYLQKTWKSVSNHLNGVIYSLTQILELCEHIICNMSRLKNLEV